MSPSGFCTACLVPGCLTCSEESPYVCLDCKKTSYMSLNSEGKCVCSYSYYRPN